MPRASAPPDGRPVVRVQTGLRLEKGLLKVLKGLAEYHDVTMGELLESIVVHAFEGQTPFDEASLATIADLKRIYGMALGPEQTHRWADRDEH